MSELSRVEELAARNVNPIGGDPCTEWDGLVEWRMSTFHEDRLTAVDRLLGTREGSDKWLRCQQWDARQPKVIVQNGVPIKTGKWGNRGPGTNVRRIPRKP